MPVFVARRSLWSAASSARGVIAVSRVLPPAIVLALASALAGCGRKTPPPGIAHLDPRLPDGRASATVLAGLRHEVARHAANAAGLDGWTIASGHAIANSFPGALEPAGNAPIALERAAALSAASCNAVEVRVLAASPGRATLRWRRKPGEKAKDAAQLAPPWPDGSSVQVAYAGSRDAQTIGFDLALHPGWAGEIEALRFEPDQGSGQRIGVESIALVERGWGFAPEALEAERGEARAAGDGGLIQLELEARRAWPAAFEQQLQATCHVPKGGALCVDTAALPALRGVVERVNFDVELRAPGGPWAKIATRKIYPKEKPGETLWRPWKIDLSPWSGADVELRFSAHDSSTSAPPERPVARVLWGAPIVIGEPPREKLPNIVLVTLDTTRLDRIGERTPYLKELAERGIACTDAWATSNSTQPSHASILTGTWVGDHGVTSNLCALGDANRTLAEVLRERGYLTVAAVSQPFLGPGSGYGQGFDWFLQASPLATFDGASTVLGARRYLELWKEQGERPFFVWIHLFDPHTPYTPPAEYAKGWAERWKTPQPDPTQPATLPALDVLPPEMSFLDGVKNADAARWRYDVEVSYADSLVENFASHLAQHGWLGSTAWVITADHGESLGERDSWFNHAGLFPEVTRVPLLVNLPGGPSGERIGAPVSSVDIAPTLLHWLGLDASGMRGTDLLALVDGQAPPQRRLVLEGANGELAGCVDADGLYVEVTSPHARFGLEVVTDAQGRRVAASRALKLGQAFLFDRKSDPACATNVAEAQAARRETYKAELAKLRAAMRSVPTVERALDDAERARLKQLGYLGR